MLEITPAHAALRAAVARAVQAPSEHNAQPWNWVLDDDHLDLHVDPRRRLPVTDASGRGALLGCGSALHHLRMALAVAGWRAEVRHGSDNVASRPIARVRAAGPTERRDARAARHAAVIDLRRTDRRRFSDRTVSPDVLEQVTDSARPYDGVAHIAVGTTRRVLTEAMRDAALRQRDQPGYAAELHRWTHRDAGAGDGIPPSSRPGDPGATVDVPMRWLPRGTLRQPWWDSGHRDASMLLVLSAVDDASVSVLRAGEALSAVLLEATALGLATAPSTQVMEVPETRERVRTATSAHRRPVAVIRLGWPLPRVEPVPPTPRRPLSAVLVEAGTTRDTLPTPPTPAKGLAEAAD